MKNQLFKNLVTLLLLVLFSSAKVANYHSYTHDSHDIIHCEFCDISLQNQLLPILTPDLTDLKVKVFCVLKESNQLDCTQHFKSFLEKENLHCRPPPFYI